ncbi:coiled-coil domain-containing protein 17 [Astyanax mexicanus]|uniref:Coiled-coil domain containing 17 n=1 Tax=Astyanax mexicanus TaxID=7994 RepID=A0A8B9LBD3_ASTMX|nr:coiled-coil domain-containing protein 17 [Astyanax mexicanus]
MEHLGELTCCDCNMAFRSSGLLDKHKARFCIGSDCIGEPVRLRRRRVESSQPEKAALRELSPKRTQTPDLVSLREQRNKLLMQKDRRETDPQDSVAESMIINKLTDEFHKLRISIEENLPRRRTERVHKERHWEAREHYGQKLAQIRAHNTQLEQQKEEIERQLAELSGQGHSAHLEDLMQELKEQEEKNEVILYQLSTQINDIHGMKYTDVSSDLVEEKRTQRGHNTFDLISVDGPLSSQIRSLRLAYMHSGGSDPEVLAHMHDLQAEAFTLEQARTRAEDKAGKGREKIPHPTVDSDIVAVQHENQKLEEEILRLQLIRERHREEEGLYLTQSHQIHQVASLQEEISSLRRELKRSRDRGGGPYPPPSIPGNPLTQTYPPLDYTVKHSVLGTHVPDPMNSLGPSPYDPGAGFVIFYDMVLGVDATFRAIHLVAGLYSRGQEMGRCTLMPPVQCQPAGTLAYPPSRNPENCALLAVKQPVPRLQPSPSLSVVLEVQTAGGLDLSGQEIYDFVPHGWTMLQLFDQYNQVHSGFWRLPFRCLPKRPSLSPAQLNSVPQMGNMEICLCVVNARDEGVQSLVKVDSNNTSHYRYPPINGDLKSLTVLEGQVTTPDTTTFITPQN